jgi:hypothetical protein
MGHHLKMIHGQIFAHNNGNDQIFFQLDANSSFKKTDLIHHKKKYGSI